MGTVHFSVMPVKAGGATYSCRGQALLGAQERTENGCYLGTGPSKSNNSGMDLKAQEAMKLKKEKQKGLANREAGPSPMKETQ